MKPLRWLLASVSSIFRAGVALWASLAIYYSNLPWHWLLFGLALAFAAFSIWALWLARKRRSLLLFAGLFACVLVWFLSIRPTHDRPWRPEVKVMPRAAIDGDRVSITGVRDFDYRGRDDFTVRYEEREVSVSHLTSIDFFVSYFLIGPVAHTFLSFNFDNAPPVCVSIETRPQVGQSFAPIASLFKQFELIYVVGNERDLVRVRTNFRREDVYLYHIRTTPDRARKLFRIYLDRINQLAGRPEFYNLLTNSCTINIVRYLRIAGKVRGFDFRYVLNGFVDSYLYSLGLLDTDLPFRDLRPRSRINDAADAADNSPDFSERIRAAVPPRQSAAALSH
ncbi:MAG TPA: DUF4105 domain-containing protein [Bryobacteraceae bacterium]|jgi:hypothetical protein|nr:DUF4105 domain-containing protein [Bryobacteraceae bacterium]